MQYLFSKACLPMLKQLAKERTLCAFDFDGTLSAIVEEPELAVIQPRTRTLLGSVALLYPCIVVSGRMRMDVLGKLGGVNVASVIGNHGAEKNGAESRHAVTATAQVTKKQVEQWKAAIEPQLARVDGVRIEDKGLSLAIHYRQAEKTGEARRMVLDATRLLRHARVFGGKMVVNVVADNAPHKGDALAVERERLGCDWVLYVGDDENDEDAFALDGNVVSVRVGRKLRSRARYYLRSQAEINDLLEMLTQMRRPAAAC
jgi:trehalose 6-phosphate phosphatase